VAVTLSHLTSNVRDALALNAAIGSAVSAYTPHLPLPPTSRYWRLSM